MAQNQLEALARSLEKQGCTVRRTKGGYFIYCPDGVTTLGFHTSNASDRRTIKNLEADVRRAGLKWPGK